MVRLDVIIIFRSVSSFKKSEIGSKLQEHFRETLNQALRKPFYILSNGTEPPVANSSQFCGFMRFPEVIVSMVGGVTFLLVRHVWVV